MAWEEIVGGKQKQRKEVFKILLNSGECFYIVRSDKGVFVSPLWSQNTAVSVVVIVVVRSRLLLLCIVVVVFLISLCAVVSLFSHLLKCVTVNLVVLSCLNLLHFKNIKAPISNIED